MMRNISILALAALARAALQAKQRTGQSTVAFSLDGFIFGPQYNAKRANYTAGMTDLARSRVGAFVR